MGRMGVREHSRGHTGYTKKLLIVSLESKFHWVSLFSDFAKSDIPILMCARRMVEVGRVYTLQNKAAVFLWGPGWHEHWSHF